MPALTPEMLILATMVVGTDLLGKSPNENA